jgi:hypothetical protein
MDERYGESCTDLLSDYGIEKCYAGWQDPTQHPAEDYPFNLKITDNADIFNTCRDIAASFLPQAMAEGTEQITWIKPNFDYEWDEIEFQAKQPQVPDDVRSYMAKHFPNKDAWLKAVQNGRAVVVPPDHGQKIRNYTDNKKDLLNALSPASHDPQGPAKAKRVNALFDKGGPIEMPIILKTSKGLWLIGGKTRLGTANLLKGIPAKVWVIEPRAISVPPIDRVPANTAVDASHAQVLDKTTGKWTAAMPRSSSAATRLSRLGGGDDVNTFGFGSPAIDQQYIEDLKKEIAKNPGDPYNQNFQDEIDRIQKNMATTQLMIKEQDVDEAYTGPPMKFLRPGELSGGYSPQQMQAMGFKQTANGTWYIPVNTWQRLVSGGQIREGSENVVDFPIANVRRPNGAIGTQGVTTNQVADVLTHLARMQVSPDMSMRELVDKLKADPQAQERLRQSLKLKPVQVLPLPDGSYHLQDGHHRTFLLNLLGDKTVPAVIQGGSPALPMTKAISVPPLWTNNNARGGGAGMLNPDPLAQLMREGANGPLASMVSQDQAERNEYKQFVQSKAGGDWDKGAQMYAQLKGRPSDDIFGDSANQDRFMKMTFDFDTFTEDDWHNYWLMAQHCDKNRDFQRQALAAIEKYQGQDHQNYHYLADRISCGTTGTQKYGTQNGCNIDSVQENFADGRHPEDKGDSKRHHVPTKSSVSNLRRFAKSHSGRAAQLAHWMANMKAGRAKKKKTNEAVDAQTVAAFTARVQDALAKIAQNTDPRYPDQKEFVKLIAANKVKIMNGNPSNPAYSLGHDLNIDAEEFHDAPESVLILVIAHEIGHILYGHTFRDPKTPPLTVAQEQQEEYSADEFAVNIMKRLGIQKVPVWTWLRRKKDDLEQFKQDQDAATPGSWPTFNQRSHRARKMGVELTKANTDQIDQALQHLA